MPIFGGYDPMNTGISLNDGTLNRAPNLPMSPASQSAMDEPIISVNGLMGAGMANATQQAPAVPPAPPPLYPSTPQGPRLQMPQGQQVVYPEMANAPPTNPAPGQDIRVGADPDTAIPFSGGAVPNGFVRMLQDAGGGRSTYGDYLLPANQNNARRGMSWAELTANNPTLGTSELAQLRTRMIGANQGLEMQNMQLANETNNRLRGVMGNTDAIAMGRNQIEAERVANEQWGRTPAGRQAMAENSAFQAFLNQPQGPNRAPLNDYVRMLQQAQGGGLFGTGTPSASIHPPTPGQQPIVAPMDDTRPPQMGASPNVPPMGYQPTPQASAYAPHEEMLNALRTRMLAAEPGAGVGSFLSQINRNQPGFVQGNLPAVESYIRDRFGNAQYEDASAGTVAHPLGGYVTPMNSNVSLWTNLGRMIGQGVSPLNPFNRSMDEEQAGRAMLANLLQSRRQ